MKEGRLQERPGEIRRPFGSGWRGFVRWTAAGVALIASMCVATNVRADSRAGPGEGATPGSEPEVGVLVMSEARRAASAVDTVVELLDRNGFEPVAPKGVRRRHRQRISHKPESDRREQFAGLTNRIAAGIEKYFYKSNEAALEKLVPIVNRGTSNLDVVIRRPGLAQQIYDAGIIVVRAYADDGRDTDASRMAGALVETFPGEPLDAESTPPKIRDLLRAERNELAEAGGRIVLEPVDGEDCNTLINGIDVERRPLVVRPDKTYHVALDCGTEMSPVWRVEVPAGEQVRVPLPRRSPTEFRLEETGYQDRRRAEAYLRAAAFWADVDRVVGIASTGGEEGTDLLIAQVTRTGDTRWSDRADARQVERMLSRVMPDYGSSASESSPGAPRGESSDRSGSGGADVLSWVLVGGGAAVGGVSTWGLIASERRSRELRCSDASSANPSPGECDGVESYRFTREEFQRARRNLRRARIASGVGLAVGVGALGWGTWRLVAPENPILARSPSMRVQVGAGAMSVGFGWKF